MGSALLRNDITGAFLWNGPVQFARIPQIGEYVQLGRVFWAVSSVLHAWDGHKQPVCELRLSPTGDNKFLLDESTPE